jgi:hypothetical protein
VNFLKKKLESITEGRSKVYIIPSKDGFKFIFINFTLFLISLSYANNMALLITFIMVSYLILQMLDAHKLIQDIQLDKTVLSDDFLGGTNTTTCYFKNKLNQGQVHNLKLELTCESKENLSSLAPTYSDDHIAKFPILIQNRGKYDIKSVKIFTFGNSNLFYVWRYFPIKQSLFIYPEKLKNKFLTSQFDQDKPAPSAEVEFEQHIPYAQGLNSKRIDWKVYARKDLLYWKKHIDYNTPTMEINYNSIPGDKETKLKKISYTIDHFFKQSKSWKLVLPNKVLKSSQGMKHYRDSLEAISEF